MNSSGSADPEPCCQTSQAAPKPDRQQEKIGGQGQQKGDHPAQRGEQYRDAAKHEAVEQQQGAESEAPGQESAGGVDQKSEQKRRGHRNERGTRARLFPAGAGQKHAAEKILQRHVEPGRHIPAGRALARIVDRVRGRSIEKISPMALSDVAEPESTSKARDTARA